MKSLQDMTMLINQGLTRFAGVALIAAAGAFVFYRAMHKGAMDLDKGYAEAFKNMKNSVGKAFEPMIQLFADVMEPVFEFIGHVADLITKFNEAHPTIAKLIAGFVLLLPALTLILAPLAIGIGLTGGLTAAFSALWLVIGPIVTGFAAMMATVLLVTAVIVGLVAGFIYMYKRFDWFKNAVDTVLSFLKDTFIAAWNTIKDVAIKAIDGLVKFGKDMMQQFAKFWDENGKQIMTYVKVAWDAISLLVKTQLNNLKLAFEIAFAAIKAVVQIFWEAIKLVFKTVMNVVLGLVEAWLAVFRGDWQGAWDAIKGIFAKTFDAIKSFADGSLNALKGLFSSILGSIKDYIATNLENVKGTFKEKWDAILAFLKAIDLVETGKNIIEGLIRGIGSMAGGLVDKAKEIANSVKDVFTNLFDINSPSRYMRDMIGVNMIKGWVNGIDAMKGKIVSTAAEMGNLMTPQVPVMAYSTPKGAGGLSQSIKVSDGGGNKANGGVVVNQTNTFTTQNYTPAEIARKQKQSMQQLAMEWR
ncbi:phage tail protein [Paenisporosarcina sp. NPDC076898]|uniref:phage tail protein n=1 Tax=unclassified Paenisporosarcina TaxID=2642018 RepID=UPI003D04DD55